MENSTFRWYDLYCLGWVLCFNMDFHTCVNLFWQKKFKNFGLYHLNLPRPTCLQVDKNGSKMLMKTMVWQSAQYIFLKSETRFKTPGKKSLIWDPAMVSMTKTQLTIRQNKKRVKIQKFHLFFQLRFGFICIPCSRSLKISPRACSLLQEGHFSSKFNYIKQNSRGCWSYLKMVNF
jgi:hypothetical protein